MITDHPLYQEDLSKILQLKGIERLKGKVFLITGASGLIGTCLIDSLMKYNLENEGGISIYAVGRSRNKAALRFGRYFDSPYFHFVEQDVRSPFPDEIKVDYILPLASNTHPLAYSQYPVETIEINVKGAENALKKAVSCGATVLYPSSVEIYGNGSEAFTEDATGKLNLGNARACYTESKRAGEALCQSYIAEYGVDCKIARLSRIFGPGIQNDDSKASSQFMFKALAGEDIVLKSKGNQVFSYTYVADAVKAMLHILLYGSCGQAYNVAGFEVKLSDFARECADFAGKSVVFDLPSEKEAKGYSVATKAVLSTEKIAGVGWRPDYSFKDSIERTLRILSSQR
jgi:nucleoside-diphosphate-sugar epimerase